MESLTNIAVAITILLNVSCATSYQKANISRIETNGGAENIKNKTLVYQYRIHGLQQMMIYLDPKRDAFSGKDSTENFTQNELSKLRIKVTSVSGKLDVNGLLIGKGDTLAVDLTKIFNSDGKPGYVRNLGKYNSIIRFVSYNNLPADDNLCDFILIVEDPEGVTRTTGLRVHGGFTDSL